MVGVEQARVSDLPPARKWLGPIVVAVARRPWLWGSAIRQVVVLAPKNADELRALAGLYAALTNDGATILAIPAAFTVPTGTCQTSWWVARLMADNVPNGDMLRAHLGKPLTRIPDPFGKFESFAHHNNAALREFLDRFGFDYEFVSASDMYSSGQFDEALRGVEVVQRPNGRER